MPFQAMPSSTRLGNFYTYCWLLASLSGINTYLFSTHSRAAATTENQDLLLAILSRELLIQSIAFTATAALLYFVLCFVSRKHAFTLSTSIAFCALAAMTISSWFSYKRIGEFVGTYTFQMLRVDGAAVLDLASRMPSMMDMQGFSTLAVVALCSVALAMIKSKPLNCLKAPVTVISVLTAAVVTWSALSYDTLTKIHPSSDSRFDINVTRIAEANYQVTAQHAGPFSKLAREAGNALRQSASDINVATAHLTPRATTKAAPPTAALHPAERLNFVFILVESLRADVIGNSSEGIPLMPFSSELADKAYVFEKAWAQASHSNYADIAAISGQHALRSEHMYFYPKNNKFPRSLPWDHLQDYGYSSALVSSQNELWGNMNHYLESPNLSFFDHVGANEPTEQSNPKPNTAPEVTVGESGQITLSFTNFMLRSDSSNTSQRDDETTAQIATEWLTRLDADQPFSLHLNFQASHYPYNYFPASHERRHLVDDTETAERVRRGLITGAEVTDTQKAYYDALQYVDDNIKAVFDTIESRSPGKTIYVITADTGTHIDSNFLGNGGTLLPDVLKVPVVIYDPRLDERVDIKTPAAQIDILPTVYGLLGVAPDPAVQGQDLLATPLDANRPIFAIAQTPAAHEYAIFEGDWQLIFDYHLGTKTALYVGDKSGIEASDMPEEKLHGMSVKLQHWISTQLQYYQDTALHSAYYPPPQTYYEQLGGQAKPAIH